MKKILITLLSISLISCSRSDSEENGINGTWKPIKIQIVSGKDLSTILSDKNANNCDEKSLLIFEENNNFSLELYSQKYLNPDECNFEGRAKGTYNFNKSNMEIILNSSTLDDNATYKVNELTSNKLTITYMTDGEDINNDGVIDKFKTFYTKN